MIRCYDAELAAAYSIDEAIMVHCVAYWIAKNQANNRHEQDGKFWTYNSQSALVKLFPEFKSRRVIQRVVGQCVAHGLLLTRAGEDRDRTLWYTLGEAAERYYDTLHQTVQCNAPNGAMDSTKRCNVYNEQLVTQIVTEGLEELEPEKRLTPEGVRELYNSLCGSLPHCRKITPARRRAVDKLTRAGYTTDDIAEVFRRANGSAFCCGKNDRGWRADFDWLANENNMTKVLEGKYETAHSAPTKSREESRYENW